MTKRDDQPVHDLRNLDSSPEKPVSAPPQGVLSGDEISNVDLQFMGHTDERRDALKDARAEAKLADEFEARGLDKQDVASAGSMIASDPASTNPGDETSEDTDNS